MTSAGSRVSTSSASGGRIEELAGVQLPMWIHEHANPGSSTYHLVSVLDVTGVADVDRVIPIMDGIIERHDALRTSFEDIDGAPIRIVHAHVGADVEIIDVRSRTKSEIDELIAREAAFHFDLRRPGLCRLRLLRRSPHELTLVFVAHHLVVDAWGMALLAQEFIDAYTTDHVGCRSSIDATYDDFVRAEHDALNDVRGQRAAEHWATVAGRIEPLDFPSNDESDGEARSTAIAVPTELAEQLTAWARQHDVTPRAMVLAAFQLVVGRLGGSHHPHIVEYMANRRAQHIGSIGSFTNPVIRALDMRAGRTPASLVRSVQSSFAASRPHDWYPFEQVVRSRSHRAELGNVDIAFSWHKVRQTGLADLAAGIAAARPGSAIDVSGLTVTARPSTQQPVGSLTLVGVASQGSLSINLEYRSDRWSDIAVRRLGERIMFVLEQFVADPGRCASEIDVVLAEERRQWEDEWTSVDRDGPGPDVLARILEATESQPDAVAIRTRNHTLSYADVRRAVDRLAGELTSNGVGAGDRVGICLDRSPELIVSMLASWRVGAAYVPIDLDLPRARSTSITNLSGLDAVVSRRSMWTDDVADRRSVRFVDIDAAGAAEGSNPPPYAEPADSDVAYVMFTSGSTGEPKGVEVRHGGVANLAIAMEDQLGLVEHDRVLAITTASFDISLVELIIPLAVGAGIVLLDRDESVDPDAVIRALDKVTVAQATPTMWRLVLGFGWAGSESLSVLCGGEELNIELAGELARRCRRLWNMYGPTETTVWSTSQQVDPKVIDASIGSPMRGTRIYVLDDRRRLVPDGTVGELWIGGRGVAHGYASRDDLTAERFVDDPFTSDGTMYRTGDLVHRRATDRRLVFHGRIDEQVKLHGHRIELGEIESALRSVHGVRAAAATVQLRSVDDPQLVGYVTLEAAADDTIAERAREDLLRTLPRYMVPSHVIVLDEIPTTANGKTDRGRLPPPAASTMVDDDGSESSGQNQTDTGRSDSDIEAVIIRTLEDVLGTNGIQGDDDFFALGGNSLLAIQLIVRLDRELGRRLPMSRLLQASTARSMAVAFQDPDSFETSLLIALKPTGRKRPFFYVSPFLVTALSMRLIADHVDPDQPMFVLQPLGLESDDETHEAVSTMASQYIEELRSVQPHGPYVLGGHCAGSVVAFEMAQQLQAAGEQVTGLLLVDSEPPNFSAPPQPTMLRLRDLARYAADGRALPAIQWKLRVFAERHWRRHFGSPDERRIARVRATHAAAHAQYRAQVFEGDAVLVRSEELSKLRQLDWHLKWSELVSGSLRVEIAPGTHAALVEPEGAAFIAGVIDDTMTASRVGRQQTIEPS